MCIIISKPKGIKLAKSVYATCFSRNPDGAGWAVLQGSTLVISKGHFEFEAFYEELAKVEEREMLIHFRVASPGMIVDQANCHPFGWSSEGDYDLDVAPVDGVADADQILTEPQYQFAIAHNGRLPWGPSATESDTNLFVQQVLGPHLSRDPHFLDANLPNHISTGLTILTGMIGDKNKIVVMRYNRKSGRLSTQIVNRKAGQDAFGCWFSNLTYLPAPKTSYYGYGDGGDELSDYDGDDLPLGRLANRAAAGGYDAFLVPDSQGWAWSYKDNSWLNKDGRTAATLEHRRYRPPIVERWHERKRLREELEAQGSTAQSDRSVRDLMDSLMSCLDKKQRGDVLYVLNRWHWQTYGKSLGVVLGLSLKMLMAKIRVAYPECKTDKDVFAWIAMRKVLNDNVKERLEEGARQVLAATRMGPINRALAKIHAADVAAGRAPVDITVIPERLDTDSLTDAELEEMTNPPSPAVASAAVFSAAVEPGGKGVITTVVEHSSTNVTPQSSVFRKGTVTTAFKAPALPGDRPTFVLPPPLPPMPTHIHLPARDHNPQDGI